jgi:hypothetical protein
VYSWIVIAAHRREMYLVGGGGGPMDIVLSGSGRLVHGPLDGRCKARNWNTLIPLVPVLRFRACPSVWSVLHTVGQRSLHLFTNYDGSPGPLSSSLFCSQGSGPPQRGRESTEHLSHWREFRPHPIPNSCSPRMIVLGEL